MKSLIILAGGCGTRLQPITQTYHKSLVLIHGKPNIENTIEVFSKEVHKIIIVTDTIDYDLFKYLKEKYSGLVEVVKNDEGRKTNTITSLYCGLDYILEHDDIIDMVMITEGDMNFISPRFDLINENESFYHLTERENEWCVESDMSSYVSGLIINRPGLNWCMSGLCGFNFYDTFKLYSLIKEFIELNIKSIYWEQALFTRLDLFNKIKAYHCDKFSQEYDTPEELRNLIGDEEFSKILKECVPL